MLVELKDGETLNGHLVSCDTWMNLVLREVVQTSPEGDRFFRLPEVYVRGNNVRMTLFGGDRDWFTDANIRVID
jgi:U6 snRNA-associated Sm-like protein LSm4